jgi:hypothetical protein
VTERELAGGMARHAVVGEVAGVAMTERKGERERERERGSKWVASHLTIFYF